MNHIDVVDHALPEERASRVRYVREVVLRLTREQLSKNSGIPINSLTNWEKVRNQGLSEAGAKRLVQAYRAEGIICTIEWLLYGSGNKPTSPYLSQESSVNQPIKTSEEEAIQQELTLFRQFYADSIDTIIADDNMAPCFWPGDVVAGKCYVGEAINKAIGLPCIIRLSSGVTLVRIVDIGEKAGCFNLTCTNSNSHLKVIKDAPITVAAPILWIRRRSFNR